MPNTASAFTRVAVQGQWLNRMTQQINACVEILCGFPKGSLTVIKGGNKQASRNSGQTHNGLAVQDNTANRGKDKVKWDRILGHVAHLREEWEGPWIDHIHGVNNNDPTAHATARGQVAETKVGGDGLVGTRKDRGYKMLVWPTFLVDGIDQKKGFEYRQCIVACHAYEQQTTKAKNLGPVKLGEVVKAIAMTEVTTKVNGVYITRKWFVTDDGRCLYDLNFQKVSTPTGFPSVAEEAEATVSDPIPELVEATVDARWANVNVNGGYGGNWSTRIKLVVKAMLESRSSLFILQEAHEEKGEHKQILAELKRQSHPNWLLVEGDGGNHFIMDVKKYKPIGKAIVVRLPYDRDFVMLNVWHIPTGVRLWTWNTHLIASDPNKGRSRAEAAVMRTEQTAVIARHLKGLKRCVGGGDANDTDYSIGSLRQACETVGHIDIRKGIPEVVNGTLNSHDGYAPNELEGEWIDFMALGPYAKGTEAGLVDTGAGSDHNLIWTRFQITGAVTQYSTT